MIKRGEVVSTSAPTVILQPPEVLETRHTPMVMCCGYWSYSLSVGLSGPTFTVTWSEDPNAPCN
jgi:hypothetical protein